MNDITPKEASEILSHYTNLGYGIVIEGEDTTKIKQALDLASKTLANGTPYNPSGDCISREALKEKLKERYYNDGLNIVTAIELINNAPTVEITEEQAINKLHETGWLIGHDKEMTTRPQGGWIPMSADCRGYSESFKCSICGAYIYPRCLEKELDYNFCPYCGAKMKGGAE